MNIIDISIILIIILGAVIGFKQGAIKRLTSILGTIIIVLIAFKYKNYLSVIMYENLPFFSFSGILKGAGLVNILIYELIAFLIIFSFLTLALKVLLTVSGVFEKLLQMTIFLSLPSKILGIFVGIIEHYIYIFLILVFLNIPIFKLNNVVEESAIGKTIINNTPVLSNLASSTIKTYTEVYVKVNNSTAETNDNLNDDIAKILLDNKIVTVESLEKLIQRNKISLSNEELLSEYRRG